MHSETERAEYVVGVGACAGGPEAISELFRAMPSRSHLALVIVQHLSPDFRSQIERLLRDKTEMPVRRIRDHMIPRQGQVYFASTRHLISIEKGRFRLAPRTAPESDRPIDTFLTSLAREYRSKSIGLILSGNCNDGLHGVNAIRHVQGTVMVQSLETAIFDRMPKRVLESGQVDQCGSPQELALKLFNHGNTAYSPCYHVDQCGSGPRPSWSMPHDELWCEEAVDKIRRKLLASYHAMEIE